MRHDACSTQRFCPNSKLESLFQDPFVARLVVRNPGLLSFVGEQLEPCIPVQDTGVIQHIQQLRHWLKVLGLLRL